MTTETSADRHLEEAKRRGFRDLQPKEVSIWEYATTLEGELARMIEKYEPIPEPVDPDLLIAREAAVLDMIESL